MLTIPRKFGLGIALLLGVLGTGELMAQDDSVQYVRRVERLRYVAFVPAKQHCENWAVASTVQSALEMEGVPVPQSELVLRVSGTDVCGPNLKSPAELVGVIQGDYRLVSGRRVQVQAQLHDVYVDPGRLIAAIRENRPFLWIWDNHIYMAVGISYVDAVHGSGVHEYDIQQIELMDPFAGAEQQPTIFQKSRLTLGQVRGIIEMSASE